MITGYATAADPNFLLLQFDCDPPLVFRCFRRNGYVRRTDEILVGRCQCFLLLFICELFTFPFVRANIGAAAVNYRLFELCDLSIFFITFFFILLSDNVCRSLLSEGVEEVFFLV